MYLRFFSIISIFLFISAWFFLVIKNKQIQLQQKLEIAEKRISVLQFDIESHQSDIDFLLRRSQILKLLQKHKSKLVSIQMQDIQYISAEPVYHLTKTD